MEIEELKSMGKIGQLYFSNCPNCTKYIVYGGKEDTITCPKCRRKYRIQYQEE